jgi:hypothetical protein
MRRIRNLVRPGGVADPAALARRGELLSLFLAVCGVIIASKGRVGLLLSGGGGTQEPSIYDPNPLVFAHRVLSCCLEDVAVGLCGLLAGIALLGLATGPRARAAVRVLAYASTALAILFQSGSIKLFVECHQFLRRDIFLLGGGFSPHPLVAQSIGWRTQWVFCLGPVGVLAVHAVGQWAFPSAWRAAASLACRPARIVAALAVVACAIPTSWAYVDTGWSDFARNPHLVLVQSLLEPPLELDGPDEGDGADPVPGCPDVDSPRLAHPPANLIIIIVESVGLRFFETYGGPLPTTPNLRRLAPRSVAFKNYYATANYSFGSSMSLFGGVYGRPLSLTYFPKFDIPSAGGHLQSLGYTTYFFGSGGEENWDYLNTADLFCTEGFDVSRDPVAPFWRRAGRPSAFRENDYGDEAMFADVLRAVREPHAGPFAILAWAYDTHFPYRDGDGPDAWDATYFPPFVRSDQVHESRFRRYLKAIWRADRFVGRLAAELEALGHAEDTLIALTSDHGESFGDHGLLAHGGGLYEDQVHVPLILINPQLGALGARDEAVGSHVDLWPTLADICALPCHPRWQGRSLLAGDADGRRAYFHGHRLGTCGVREGPWKCLWDFRKRRYLLFDVSSDPSELVDLAGSRPLLRDRLGGHLKSWLASNTRSLGGTGGRRSAKIAGEARKPPDGAGLSAQAASAPRPPPG